MIKNAVVTLPHCAAATHPEAQLGGKRIVVLKERGGRHSTQRCFNVFGVLLDGDENSFKLAQRLVAAHSKVGDTQRVPVEALEAGKNDNGEVIQVAPQEALRRRVERLDDGVEALHHFLQRIDKFSVLLLLQRHIDCGLWHSQSHKVKVLGLGNQVQ
jgi:hypothetical protein